MERFERLTNFLDEKMNQNLMPGYDCIVYHEGKEVYRHFNGLNDIENKTPMCGNEKYFIYSASKVITCAAAMHAYEEGKFLFTDPVGIFLPEFWHCQVLVKTDDGEKLEPLKRPIRIQDLFTMTSGIMGSTYEKEILEEIAKHGPNFTTRQMVYAISKVPLRFQPGEQFLYGLSHDVLACLVEVAVGMPFNDYVKKVIFDPLEMHDTTYLITDEVKASVSQQHIRNFQTGEVTVYGKKHIGFDSDSYASGGSGVVTTIADYIKFATAMTNYGLGLNGKRILNKSTVNLMRTPLLKGLPFEQFNANPNNAEYSYAFGVKTKIGAGWGGNLASVGEFGWDGAAGAFVSMDPERNITILYLQHMVNPYLNEVHPRIRSLVHLALGY